MQESDKVMRWLCTIPTDSLSPHVGQNFMKFWRTPYHIRDAPTSYLHVYLKKFYLTPSKKTKKRHEQEDDGVCPVVDLVDKGKPRRRSVFHVRVLQGHGTLF